jgi:hypothetical protein
VKLIKEVEGHGLALVQGADPSWWSTDDLMAGFPTPAQVHSWWPERPPDPPEPAGQPGQPDNTPSEDGKPHTYADSAVRADSVSTRTGPG